MSRELSLYEAMGGTYTEIDGVFILISVLKRLSRKSLLKAKALKKPNDIKANHFCIYLCGSDMICEGQSL